MARAANSTGFSVKWIMLCGLIFLMSQTSEFDTVWQAMTPKEQNHLIHLLIEQVEYDGHQGQVSITFHPCGLQTLIEDLGQKEQCA